MSQGLKPRIAGCFLSGLKPGPISEAKATAKEEEYLCGMTARKVNATAEARTATKQRLQGSVRFAQDDGIFGDATESNRKYNGKCKSNATTGVLRCAQDDGIFGDATESNRKYNGKCKSNATIGVLRCA
jgi:hypothetical protein